MWPIQANVPGQKILELISRWWWRKCAGNVWPSTRRGSYGLSTQRSSIGAHNQMMRPGVAGSELPTHLTRLSTLESSSSSLSPSSCSLLRNHLSFLYNPVFQNCDDYCRGLLCRTCWRKTIHFKDMFIQIYFPHIGLANFATMQCNVESKSSLHWQTQQSALKKREIVEIALALTGCLGRILVTYKSGTAIPLRGK